MLVFIIPTVCISNNARSMSYSWLNIWFLSSIIDKESCIFSQCSPSVFSFCTSVGVSLYMDVQSAFTDLLCLQQTRDRDLVREYSQIHLCVSSTIKINISMRRTETSSFKLCLYCWGYQTAEVHTAWLMCCAHTHDNVKDRFSARGRKNYRKAQRRRENRMTLVFWTWNHKENTGSMGICVSVLSWLLSLHWTVIESHFCFARRARNCLTIQAHVSNVLVLTVSEGMIAAE